MSVEFVSTNPTCYMSSTGSLLLQGRGGNITGYTFSVNGSEFSGENEITSLASGTYFIVAKDSNDCPSDSMSISLIDPSGIN